MECFGIDDEIILLLNGVSVLEPYQNSDLDAVMIGLLSLEMQKIA